MQLGVTLTSLGIGALGEPVLATILDPVLATFLAVAIAFVVITFLHVVIGELVPKGIALGYPERTALAVSAPVRGFFVLFAPFVWLLQRSTGARAPPPEPVGAGHRDRGSFGGRAEDARPHLERGGRDRAR